ncbi:hypothetical protein ASF40_20230 [Microbacterium sp. Leaf288]|uniref:hypothetical protein n=1 Tax=Microbacterium sp. Leaf288 TaxID=1736323 RepID=UPI0006F4128B|nr:hypothetical protein [Microbacterium sp. Leaf288]KQP67694.1 hypothetical protein ASF40_20230 [Microbacterium sp. Leaf288]
MTTPTATAEELMAVLDGLPILTMIALVLLGIIGAGWVLLLQAYGVPAAFSKAVLGTTTRRRQPCSCEQACQCSGED